MTRFSVILPVSNDPDHYRDAIESVLAQSFADLELIVIDDGSDPPVTVPGDDRIVEIRRDAPTGPAAARNAGLAVASGELVTFLDSDDLYLPDRLADVAVMPEGVDLICSLAGSGPPERLDLGGMLRNTTPPFALVTIRRDILMSVGGFDENYLACEDVELWIRLAQCGVRAVSADSNQWVYRPNDRPRPLHGDAARLHFSARLLDEHADFFGRDRRARAFRWRRIHRYSLTQGQPIRALGALVRSALIWPTPGTGLDALRMGRLLIGSGWSSLRSMVRPSSRVER